jgi:hypothetical protein
MREGKLSLWTKADLRLNERKWSLMPLMAMILLEVSDIVAAFNVQNVTFSRTRIQTSSRRAEKAVYPH